MKEEIVKEFLGRGKLLTPDALEMIMKGTTPEEHKGVVVTGQDIKPAAAKNYRILKNLTSKKKELTAEDFVNFYRTKYEKIRDILVGKMQKNFISLNKLDNFRNEVYVVGIAREIRENEGKSIIELEDNTAAVPIIFEDGVEDIELDDVIAVKAVSAKNVLFGKQIIFPDVPLRQPTTGYGSGCFVSSLHLDESAKPDIEKFFSWFEKEPSEFLFVSGDIGGVKIFEKYVDKYWKSKTIFVIPGEKDSKNAYPQPPLDFENKNIISLSNPSLLEVYGLKILLVHEFLIGFLKKRYLGKQMHVDESGHLVLDDVPDIVCYGHTDYPHTFNYKATTIVNSGSLLGDFRPVTVDFATRDVKQVQL